MGRPWKYRPDSATKGFVQGNMVGGWVVASLFLLIAVVTWDAWALALAAVYVVIGALGTYMWRHG